MAMLDAHVLYYKPTCGYCAKVLNFMADNDIQCELRNTTDEYYAKELVEVGGKRQVPCLVIKGEALYESDDIIKYLATQL